MYLLNNRKKKLYVFFVICILVSVSSYVHALLVLPGQITLAEGDDLSYNIKSPFLISIKADKEGVVSFSSHGLNEKKPAIHLSKPISLISLKQGCVSLKMKLFGIIPVKTMEINVIANKEIAACGNSIGVKLKLNGLMVIGISDVSDMSGKECVPAKKCGIKPGDLILQANGVILKEVGDLIDEVDKSNGKTMQIKYRHGQRTIKDNITPVMSSDDSKYHLGIWIRDSTAGIGTLTFIDPKTGSYGALGHGITDLDTGALMPVKSGEILESSILSIRKGKKGTPGELRGVFIDDGNDLGSIKNNCEYGIYGTINKNYYDRFSDKLYPVALRSQVKEGNAKIMSNIDGTFVEEYSIEIQKVNRQKINSSKGMVIKVTDKRLLDASGGIVQGMSGSPIIQDGRIVGAVTHVLVNDPTRGYGIFIENMLKNISNKGTKQAVYVAQKNKH